VSGIEDVTLSVREAAVFFRVAESTVKAWLRRYKMEPAGLRWEYNRYVNTYAFLDLAESERSTRREPRGRPRGSLKGQR
jgi:transposase